MNSTSLNWRKRSPIADYFMPSNFQFGRNFSTYDAMGRWDDVTMIMRPILNVRVYSWQICQCANKNFPIMIACCQVTTAKQRIAKKILIAFSIVFILETTQCNSSCTGLVHHSFSSTFLQWSLSQFFSHKKFTISQIRRHSHSAHKKYPYCPKKRRSAAVFLCAFRLTSFSQSLLFLWIFCFFPSREFFLFHSQLQKKIHFVRFILYVHTMCQWDHATNNSIIEKGKRTALFLLRSRTFRRLQNSDNALSSCIANTL